MGEKQKITPAVIGASLFSAILSGSLLYIVGSILFIFIYLYLNRKYLKYYLIALFLSLILALIIQGIKYHEKSQTFIPFGKKVIFTGEVISHPYIKGKFKKFILKVDKIYSRRVSFKVQVFSFKNLKIELGDRVTAKARIIKPEGPKNFGEIDYGLYLKKLRLDGVCFLLSPRTIISINKPSYLSFPYIGQILRKKFKNFIDETFYPVPASIIKAITIGVKDKNTYKLRKYFIQTGTVHLLAISGLHTGIIAFIFISLFNLFRLKRISSILLTSFILLIYNYVVGYRPSIMRATVMFYSFTITYLFDRDKNYLNALAVALIAVLIINPESINTISFQFSFLATLGIILYSPIFYRLILKNLSIKNKIFEYIAGIISASISAQLFIFPFQINTFHKFAPGFIIANIFAIPLITIVLFLTFISFFVSFISLKLCFIFIPATEFILAILVNILKLLGQAIPYVYITSFSRIQVFMFYLALLLPFISIPHLKIFKKESFIKPVLVILLFILSFIRLNSQKEIKFSSKGKYPEIVFFNIKGKSVFLKERNKYLLIDGGYYIDAIRHIIPFLNRNRIKSIDYMIMTNPLRYRAEGLLEILKQKKVKTFLESGYTSSSFLYERIIETITAKRIRYKAVNENYNFKLGRVKIKILSPPEGFFQFFAPYSLRALKENSLVILISFRRSKILLVSDIYRRAIKYLRLWHCREISSCIVEMPDVNCNDFFVYKILECANPALIVVNKKFTPFEKNDKEFITRAIRNTGAKGIFIKREGAIKVVLNGRKFIYITSR